MTKSNYDSAQAELDAMHTIKDKNGNLRLHATNGPALEWGPDKKYKEYYYKGELKYSLIMTRSNPSFEAINLLICRLFLKGN